MTTPTLAPDFAAPTVLTVTRGAYTAVRLPIPRSCTCAVTGFECDRCFLDTDAAFTEPEWDE